MPRRRLYSGTPTKFVACATAESITCHECVWPGILTAGLIFVERAGAAGRVREESAGCGLKRLVSTFASPARGIAPDWCRGGMAAALSGSLGRRSGAQRGVRGAIFGLIGEGGGHGEFDVAHADAHQGPDLQQLETDCAAGRTAELGVDEADAAQGADQHIGHRGEPQPQLVGAHRLGRGAAGIEVKLAFLDAVLHLAAGAIELLVEVASLVLLAAQRGDDEARVGLARPPPCYRDTLGLGDDATLAAPAVARLPGEVPEAAGRLAGLLAELGRGGELGFDLLNQPGVA